MTTNQTIDGVLGEMLERIADPYRREPRSIHLHNADIAELRALLDKTEADIPASTPRGEPVYMKPQYLSVPGLWIECKKGEIHAKPFYAEQPAPVAAAPINYGALGPVERLAVCRGEQVAVVLPERLPGDDGVCTESHYASGWNTCLDELKRLNPSL